MLLYEKSSSVFCSRFAPVKSDTHVKATGPLATNPCRSSQCEAHRGTCLSHLSLLLLLLFVGFLFGWRKLNTPIRPWNNGYCLTHIFLGYALQREAAT